MIHTPSSKLLFLVALLVAMLVQNTYAASDDDYPFGEEESRAKFCPEAALIHYKDCRGPIVECSNCLQKAEKQCIYNHNSALAGDAKWYSCNDCTSIAGENCDNAHYV